MSLAMGDSLDEKGLPGSMMVVLAIVALIGVSILVYTGGSGGEGLTISLENKQVWTENNGLRLGLRLSNENILEGKESVVAVTLTNERDDNVTVAELDAGWGALDFVIEAPSGSVWKGPGHIIESFGSSVTLSSGENVQFKTSFIVKENSLSLKNVPSFWMSSIPIEEGEYKIATIYRSRQEDIMDNLTWEGQVKTPSLKFKNEYQNESTHVSDNNLSVMKLTGGGVMAEVEFDFCVSR